MAAIKDLFNEFLQFSDLRDKSVQIYRNALKYWLNNIGNVEVTEIDTHHCERFKLVLKKGYNGKSRAGSSANFELAGMRSFFSWCIKNKKLKDNPFRYVKNYKTEEIDRPIYQPEEIAKLLDACNIEMKIVVLLGLCGYRRGEILNLTYGEIDWEHNTIKLRSKPENDKTWLWNIKNNKSIDVSMPKMLSGLILEKQNQPGICPYICLTEVQYKKNLRKKAAGLLDRNRPWIGINHRLREAQKRAKIPYRSLQDLRDTYATQLASEMNIREVQVLMRHSNIQTTAKYYIRINKDKLRTQATQIIENYVM